MAQITIKINSREYSLSCEDGQEDRIVELSQILDEKATQIIQSTGQINESLLLVMVGIIMADELKNKSPKSNKDKALLDLVEIKDKEFSEILKSFKERVNSLVDIV